VILLAARMTAEIGFPWLSNLSGLAHSLPIKLMGITALGPKGLVVLSVIGAVVAADMANSVAAQETTISRLRDRAGGGMPRWLFSSVLTIGVCLAVVASVIFTLRDNYATGAQKEVNQAKMIKQTLTSPAGEIDRLKTQGRLGEVEGVHGLGRLARLDPPKNCWHFILLGAFLVGGCAALRLRYTWWPFHPLPLLFFGTWAMSRMFFSFLVGWAIKVALLKIGGGRVFARLKPLFIGIVVGQVVAAGFWICVNVVYYLVTGKIHDQVAVYFFI
jgi:hypothetical protein